MDVANFSTALINKEHQEPNIQDDLLNNLILDCNIVSNTLNDDKMEDYQWNDEYASHFDINNIPIEYSDGSIQETKNRASSSFCCEVDDSISSLSVPNDKSSNISTYNSKSNSNSQQIHSKPDGLSYELLASSDSIVVENNEIQVHIIQFKS